MLNKCSNPRTRHSIEYARPLALILFDCIRPMIARIYVSRCLFRLLRRLLADVVLAQASLISKSISSSYQMAYSGVRLVRGSQVLRIALDEARFSAVGARPEMGRVSGSGAHAQPREMVKRFLCVFQAKLAYHTTYRTSLESSH